MAYFSGSYWLCSYTHLVVPGQNSLRGAGCAPGDIEAGDLGAGSRLLPVYSRYSISGGGQGEVAGQ